MKTNKKKGSPMKKLLPAFAMLTVSAMSLSSATYAWFSMNKEVTVTGLQLTAKSDSRYLIIGESSDLDTLQGLNGNSTTLTFSGNGASLEVFPSQHNPGGASETAVVGNTKVTNTSSAIIPGNWYYKIADSPTASTSTGTATALASFDDYVLHKTVYVTLAKGSQAASNLKVKSASFTTTDVKSGTSETFNAVTVLVTSSTAYDQVAADTVTPTGTVLASSVTDAAVVPIDLFIYYDGDDTSVYTNNIANLEGATVSLTFEVDGGNV
jgi:hypothetical protein